MANGSISIRCPGCGNPHPVAMAVGQQLQCSVCQTVFFAPVYDPGQHPESAPPVPNPSPSAPQAGLGNDRETREHARLFRSCHDPRRESPSRGVGAPKSANREPRDRHLRRPCPSARVRTWRQRHPRQNNRREDVSGR